MKNSEKLLITLVLCSLKTFVINLSLGDRKGAALHEELRVEMLKWFGRCRHSQYPSRSSSRSSRKISFLGRAGRAEASSFFDARVGGDEELVELSRIGRIQDVLQALPPQLVDECSEFNLIEFSVSGEVLNGCKAIPRVFVSDDVRFSFGEGPDVFAEVHPFHDAGDALVLQKRTKWRLWTTEMSKILCTWFGEICSCCSLTVLPGPAWVLLNYVLQRILL